MRSVLKAPLVAGGLLAGAAITYLLIKRAGSHRVAKDVHIESSIAINRTPEELYNLWHELTNLPLFMSDIKEITQLDNKQSHWVAKGINGSRVEWDAEIYNDKKNELIAWRSLDNADVVNAGTVRFESGPKGHGTFVRVTMNYNPPAGVIGKAVAQLLRSDPETMIDRDLKQFKQMMESGEVATVTGQPSGRSQRVA